MKFQEVTSEYVHLESAEIFKFDSADDFNACCIGKSKEARYRLDAFY